MVQGRVVVVGIGADGALAAGGEQVVREADVLLGGARQLALVPDVPGQVRQPWPSPLREGLLTLLESYAGAAVAALASGDPLVSGIGSTLVDLLGADAVTLLPAVSSVALARARMGWSAETSETLSLVGRDPALLHRVLAPGRRVLVLASDATTPGTVARLLVDAGWLDARLTVLGDLGTATESRVVLSAAELASAAPHVVLPALAVVAVELFGTGTSWGVHGLPDEAFEHDGQLTKRDLRASALARLSPRPGELLWDVGAGAGSVGIEWMRTHPTCAAVAVESDPVRAERVGRNAARLGVPGLRVVLGHAPEALDGLPRPDAVFVGGGATEPGLLDRVRATLAPGGRLVVHGVTLETDALLTRAHAEHGGELSRVHVEHAAPIGSFTGWTPARAVTQWTFTSELS